MPVQPHTRTRAPYLTASAGWRWPRVASADVSPGHKEASRHAHEDRKVGAEA